MTTSIALTLTLRGVILESLRQPRGSHKRRSAALDLAGSRLGVSVRSLGRLISWTEARSRISDSGGKADGLKDFEKRHRREALVRIPSISLRKPPDSSFNYNSVYARPQVPSLDQSRTGRAARLGNDVPLTSGPPLSGFGGIVVSNNPTRVSRCPILFSLARIRYLSSRARGKRSADITRVVHRRSFRRLILSAPARWLRHAPSSATGRVWTRVRLFLHTFGTTVNCTGRAQRRSAGLLVPGAES